MRVLFFIPAVMFVVLSAYANLLFISSLGLDTYSRVFWIGLALTSSAVTVAGAPTIAHQLRAGYRARACAALVLLLCAGAFDSLAVYSVARSEQRTVANEAERKNFARDVAMRDLKTARADLEKVADALPIAVAEASVKAARGRKAREAARVGLARASAKRDAESRLKDAERARAKAGEGVRDTRTEFLPEWALAVLPVIMVSFGALAGFFAVETPSTAPAAAQPPALAVVPFQGDRRLEDIYNAAPSPLVKDKDGWLRGSQRALAKALGIPLPATNMALRDAASAGRIELQTSPTGTAFRVVC